LPTLGTEAEVQGIMQFEDLVAVTNFGPKIKLKFDLSAVLAADGAVFDFNRAELSLFASGRDSNNDCALVECAYRVFQFRRRVLWPDVRFGIGGCDAHVDISVDSSRWMRKATR
jgi:hypothetical protein